MTLLAASGVAVGGRGLLIQGPPGSGKSSLALALIDRGAVLIGDDGVELETRNGRLWAGPPPNIAGLLEVRNVGLVTLATTSAPIALLIALNPEAARHVETADRMTLLGCELPLARLWPDSPVLALRAEQALKLHGLR
jgi:serine kinase of HPr protein (carbohydrate metabolism regulator)